MKRTLVAACLLAGTSLLALQQTSQEANVKEVTYHNVGVTTNKMPYWATVPCEYEDSVNCYWDAGSSGNGEGHSFMTHKVDGKVCYFYVQRKFAKKHDHC